MKAKAILIDAENRTISEVEYNGNYKEIYKFIKADLFTAVQINEHNILFVDDEGLLHGKKDFFIYPGYPQPLAGNGLILGSNEEGETVSTTINVADIKDKIEFRRLRVEGFDHRVEEGEWMGSPMTYIKNTPIFSKIEDGGE